MNLPKLFRTSSFRLTLIHAGFTGASFLVLFAVIMWSATRFMQHQLDLTVGAEITEVRTAAGSDSSTDLARAVTASIKGAGGFFYLLQDRSGVMLAGNMPALDPVAGPRDLQHQRRFGGHRYRDVRGRGEPTADGGYLFVGTDSREVHELRESVSWSFLLGAVAAMVIVLIGGAWMSLTVLRRIESMSQASRDIVNDGLKRRILLNGSGDEFDHLAVSLNAMFDRIQVLMDGLRQVSSDIAHDLRTPLTRLRQRLELAQMQPLDAAALRMVVGATIEGVDAILATFSALLRIAQVEGGASLRHFEQVDFSELLQTVAEVYQPAFEDKAQHFEQSIPPGLTVHGDRELLTQMFANLVENASQHSPQGARIVLAASTPGTGIEVSVADDGPGIPEHMREKVMQRFVRLDSSRTTPGNGLGLSLVAAVANLHGISLSMADNAPGLVFRARFKPGGVYSPRNHASPQR